jgi:hypothetical protein
MMEGEAKSRSGRKEAAGRKAVEILIIGTTSRSVPRLDQVAVAVDE